MPDFLLEIGSEEIPARMISAGSQELRERVAALIDRERLTAREIVTFDTPRRLAVMASGIAAAQADVVEQVTGPSLNVAYKDGQPTPAAYAFAKKAGVEVSNWKRCPLRKASTCPPGSQKRDARRRRFWPRRFPERFRRFTGRRICIGEI